MQIWRGVLYGWSETGTEGMVWVLLEDGYSGYDAMRFVEEDDRLKIYGENGEVLFDGKIVEDRKAGWEEYPKNSGHGQPCALGFWIHWTQKGWEPDKWAALFLHEYAEEGNGKPLRAELYREHR